MSIPDPQTETFSPAPAGKLRVVAWRQRTETWPHPDLVPLHTERATLLHWWADAFDLEVNDWGKTDAERPAEFVETLVDLAQATLTTALGALATGYVRQFFERRKSKESQKSILGQTGDSVPPLPDVPPLMAVTIVNQSGGTVVVLNSEKPDEIARALQKVIDPTWRGREIMR